ncbi:hypothetical protein EOPP23_07600 [Endozoicomonas sp. OPT23]|uniref:hypothetical protein n=1 Tax=Endozoicomonas sp. OPT23 TaxID=2072845 RepID=UPI00129A5068|nr:hypothetical protein [Endozoicomonas sp. OPT23]MRI32848.1 hypothetical protein [Endozoicomonas sp. OPT23]
MAAPVQNISILSSMRSGMQTGTSAGTTLSRLPGEITGVFLGSAVGLVGGAGWKLLNLPRKPENRPQKSLSEYVISAGKFTGNALGTVTAIVGLPISIIGGLAGSVVGGVYGTISRIHEALRPSEWKLENTLETSLPELPESFDTSNGIWTPFREHFLEVLTKMRENDSLPEDKATKLNRDHNSLRNEYLNLTHSMSTFNDRLFKLAGYCDQANSERVWEAKPFSKLKPAGLKKQIDSHRAQEITYLKQVKITLDDIQKSFEKGFRPVLKKTLDASIAEPMVAYFEKMLEKMHLQVEAETKKVSEKPTTVERVKDKNKGVKLQDGSCYKVGGYMDFRNALTIAEKLMLYCTESEIGYSGMIPKAGSTDQSLDIKPQPFDVKFKEQLLDDNDEKI